MPSRNVVRNFTEGGYYHVLNRGVEKRKIFLDEQDHRMFLYYLFVYLMPLEKVLNKYPLLPIRLHNKNLNSEIQLLAYCLMPNHFHFLLRQTTKNAISKLMKQLTNAYTLYFNQKHNRVGPLMQGRFKAVHIDTDDLLLHVSRYIHLNPVSSSIVEDIHNYQWSSYHEYLEMVDSSICVTDVILSYFPSKKEYSTFILDQAGYSKELNRIKHLSLEDNEI